MKPHWPIFLLVMLAPAKASMEFIERRGMCRRNREMAFFFNHVFPPASGSTDMLHAFMDVNQSFSRLAGVSLKTRDPSRVIRNPWHPSPPTLLSTSRVLCAGHTTHHIHQRT